jgi:hypothetical protein
MLKPNLSIGKSFSGVLLSTVTTSTSSPAFDKWRNISLNRLEYPDTCVKGVGSTIRQTLRGGLWWRGGASFDSGVNDTADDNADTDAGTDADCMCELNVNGGLLKDDVKPNDIKRVRLVTNIFIIEFDVC